MSDFRTATARLRREAGCPDDLPLGVERVLPRLYPVATVRLPSLTVQRLAEWLSRHQAEVPPGLATAYKRRLLGAAIAWRGHGFLCVDAGAAEVEQRFTFAHEAGHYLMDHVYPRLIALERFGDSIQPVLDGLRAPTIDERVDAVLGRTSISLLAHLMGRDGEGPLGPSIEVAEEEADSFACELLAPTASLRQQFGKPQCGGHGVESIRRALMNEYGLPFRPAARWAERFVGLYGREPTLLNRLGFS